MSHVTASLQFRWLAQPLPHGLFVGEILVFLLFRGKLTKRANYGMRQDAADDPSPGLSPRRGRESLAEIGNRTENDTLRQF